MTETTLISTFYSFKPFVAAAHKYSPSKIILLIAEDTTEKEEVKTDINQVKKIYGDITSVKVEIIKSSEILGIAKQVTKLIERNTGKIIVNISGGRRILTQAVVYGCYARHELVDKIACNNLADDSVVELPKLSFKLSPAKKKLLKEIAKRKGRSIAEIAKRLGKKRGTAYQHLKELRDSGYVDEKFDITDAGRLALL